MDSRIRHYNRLSIVPNLNLWRTIADAERPRYLSPSSQAGLLPPGYSATGSSSAKKGVSDQEPSGVNYAALLNAIRPNWPLFGGCGLSVAPGRRRRPGASGESNRKYFSDFSISYWGWSVSVTKISDLKATKRVLKAG